MNSSFLKPGEIVSRWRNTVTEGTLAVWRSIGKGPPYIKSGRSVLYPLDELEKYEKGKIKGVVEIVADKTATNTIRASEQAKNKNSRN
jgi:hypothetical protein